MVNPAHEWYFFELFMCWGQGKYLTGWDNIRVIAYTLLKEEAAFYS